jgi:hypothetical protein
LFEPGRYDVRLIRASEETLACYFVVTNDWAECALSGHCVTESSCNAGYLVGYAGYGIPDEVGIGYPLIEDTVAVSVKRDGIPVGNATFVPAYKTIQPNGPECGPTCRIGEDSLFVD